MRNNAIKEFFSQTAIYGVGLFINRFLSFLLIPLYTFFYSPSELGMLNIVLSLWLFVSVFYVFGMESSFIKFFTEEKSNEGKKKIYSTTISLLIITSLIFSAIIYINTGNISELIKFENPEKGSYLVKLLAVLLFFDTISRFPLLLLRAELNPKKYIILSTISLIINLILNVIFITVIRLGVESVIYAYIVSYLFSFIYGIITTSEYFGIRLNFEAAKRLSIFGTNFIFIGLFILIIDVSDRFFLKYFFDESIVGIYSTNYRLASAMGLIISAFKFSFTPYFLNIAENPDNKKIISSIFSNYVFAGLFFFLIFAFLIPPIVTIKAGGISILDERYQSGLIILPVILLSYFFSGLFTTFNAAPFFKSKTGYMLLVATEGVIVNIILNLLLIPALGMTGAAFATLLSYLIMYVHIYFISQKVYKIEFEWTKISMIILLSVAIYLINTLINFYLKPGGIISVLINTGLIIIYFYSNIKSGTVSLAGIKSILSKKKSEI